MSITQAEQVQDVLDTVRLGLVFRMIIETGCVAVDSVSQVFIDHAAIKVSESEAELLRRVSGAADGSARYNGL